MAKQRKLSMLIRTAGRKPVKLGPGERMRIGRHASNDLVFNDGTVSRFHAVMVWDPDEDRPYVRDNESANGVEVNGKPIDERRHLDGGDTISIGDFTLSLELRAEEVEAEDGAAALASSSDDEVSLFTDTGKELQGETRELSDLHRLFLELEEQRRTGTLQLTGAELNGVCLFSQGKVMAAEAGELKGREGLKAFFDHAKVKYHFSKALKPTESALEISVKVFLAQMGVDTRRTK